MIKLSPKHRNILLLDIALDPFAILKPDEVPAHPDLYPALFTLVDDTNGFLAFDHVNQQKITEKK